MERLGSLKGVAWHLIQICAHTCESKAQAQILRYKGTKNNWNLQIFVEK
jgi:hypothetical protein